MAKKCRCEPNPKTLAIAGYQSFIGTADKPGPLWPTEEDCNPETKDLWKRACEARRGLLGRHVTNQKGGDFFSPKSAAGNITVTAGDGTKIAIKQGEGHPWVWVEEPITAFVPPAPKSTVKPKPAPPDADKPNAFTGSVPEQLKDFNEQCFLLEFAKPIYEKFGSGSAPPENSFEQPVRSLSWIKRDEGSQNAKWEQNINYISHITAGLVPAQTMRSFFEMTADEKAQIVPFIQISVDYYDKAAIRVDSAILDFPNEVNLDTSVLRATGQRRLAGIKSISINLDGIDEVMAKVVKLNASFIFQDFRTIFKGSPSDDVRIGKGAKLRNYYSDLFSYGSRDINNENLYKKLRFKIGWSGRTHAINSEKDSLSAKLGLNERTLILDVGIEKYNFDFNVDGSVTVNISYIGTMDNSFNGPSSNLLSMVKATMTEMQKNQASAHTTKMDTITKVNEDGLRKTNLIQVAETLFKMKVLKEKERLGGGAALYKWKGPAQQSMKTNFPEGANTAGKTGQGGYAWSWEGKEGLDTGVFSTEILRGDIQAFYNRNTLELSDTDADTLVGQLQRLYKKTFLDTTTRSINPDQNVQVTGVFRLQLEQLLKSLGKDTSVAKGAGIIAGSGEQTSKTEKTQKANIRNAAATAQAAILRQLAAVKFQGLRQIAIGLLKQQKIYYAKITQTQKFKLNANLQVKDKMVNVLAEMVSAADKILGQYPTPEAADYEKQMQAIVTWEELMAGSFQLIPFVFVGELLDTLLKLPTDPTVEGGTDVYQLITTAHSEKFKVDLGYIYYSGPLTENALLRFPLYYLPISLKRLNNFFVRNIIGKELTFYSFKNFVVDLLNEFLVSAQQNCAKDAQSQGAMMPSLDFIYGKTYEDRYWHVPNSPHRFSRALGKSPFKTWFLFGTQNSVNEIPTNDPTQPGVKAFGSYSFNMKNKIFHFYLGGQSKGIVKAIKLIDNTNPDLKAAIYLKQRPGKILGETDMSSQGVFPPLVFKVEIQTVGCSTFHLGQYIFLDARQYVDAAVNRIFQISGYYRIFKVEHTAARDNFATTVTAILEESLDDFNAGRSQKAATGDRVSLTVPGTDKGKGEIITQTTGTDPNMAKVQAALQREIIKLAGTDEITADTFNDAWLDYWFAVTHKPMWPTEIHEAGVTPEGHAEGTGQRIEDYDRYKAIRKLGGKMSPRMSNTAFVYLRSLLWNGWLMNGAQFPDQQLGGECDWTKSAAGAGCPTTNAEKWFPSVVEAMISLAKNQSSLIKDGEHGEGMATWFTSYASGGSAWRFQDSDLDFLRPTLNDLAVFFDRYAKGLKTDADLQKL